MSKSEISKKIDRPRAVGFARYARRVLRIALGSAWEPWSILHTPAHVSTPLNTLGRLVIHWLQRPLGCCFAEGRTAAHIGTRDSIVHEERR